jgi:hypothetical protein
MDHNQISVAGWRAASCAPSPGCAVCIVSHETAGPVVDVANRIGHNQRPATQRGSSSGTRPEKAAQGGVLFSLWTINAQLQTSARMQPDSSECLFLTGQKGRKKPHQPALAHCVRVAGRYALRLTALPRVGAANRKGPWGYPVTRSDICDGLTQTPIRDAGPKVIPLWCPSAAQRSPRRRTAKGPENESAKEREERRQAVPLFFSILR